MFPIIKRDQREACSKRAQPPNQKNPKSSSRSKKLLSQESRKLSHIRRRLRTPRPTLQQKRSKLHQSRSARQQNQSRSSETSSLKRRYSAQRLWLKRLGSELVRNFSENEPSSWR
eukprot:Protomagalhaensia_sp_Gyna_25__2968@NODE_2747_length_910_cov_13_423651_g2291_i0_p2_GENE_NODE_2747_length_910_cov_13_423651_g2291_i0NODE_2747_length_910_cov_13_423651_g2291_i0_p2_ORF_typecomplete_len115_score5_95Use1/PF09753_9/0_14UPF0449/PF15136_6/0_18UPF0449/PF15136_6/1_3e03Exonuc_VII_L/PF02601_15/0_41_NODE_2747_length_910_cov_13_423651_g2291_i0444788